jgi:hypothetical protein
MRQQLSDENKCVSKRIAFTQGEEQDNALFKRFAQWLIQAPQSSHEKPTGYGYLAYSGIGEDQLVIMLRRWIESGLVMDIPPAKPDLTLDAMLATMKPDHILSSQFILRMRGKSLAVRMGVVGVELPPY